MSLHQHPVGNYRFLTGIAPYSSAVIADPGYTLVRGQFPAPIPYRAAFERISTLLDQFHRPKQSLCAVELRIPAPLSFQGFIAFNQEYCSILHDWDIYVGDANPVARTNVAPGQAAPVEPAIYAFTFTVTLNVANAPSAQGFSATLSPDSSPAFVVAGAGDLRDQAQLHADAIVRPDETSPDAMQEKAATVLDVMEERLTGIGRSWEHVATTNVYTVQPIDRIHNAQLLPRLGAAAIHGVNWVYSHPPIAGLAFEMDLRTVGLNIRTA